MLELARHPLEDLGVLVAVLRLPGLEVELSASRNGQSLRNRFGRRLFGVRVASLGQAVLRLPPTFEEYLSGRSRRAVRNNLSRSRAAGLSVERVPDPIEQKRLITEVEARRPSQDWWIALDTRDIPEPQLEWFAVSDAGGTVLGVAAVCVDVKWAHLVLLTCVTDDARASGARYLLHTHVVQELIERRVRYLNSDSGLRLAPGVRYLQHVLGYGVVNLRLLRPRGRMRLSREMAGSARLALQRAVQTHGLRGTVSRVPHYLGEVHFDLWNGVRTAGLVQVNGRAPLDGAGGYYAYAPVPIQGFTKALRRFRVPTEQTFVDFGCGKGRALILAARYGFPRVVGIDLVREFCVDAERNLVDYQRRRRKRAIAEVVCVDAAEYPVQPDDAVFFFYNPFPADVLRAVLRNIRQSLALHPREIRLIYAYPAHADVLHEDGFWQRMDSIMCARFGEIVLYQPA